MKFRNAIVFCSLGGLFILSGCNDSDGKGNVVFVNPQDVANASTCPNTISLSPKGLTALPDTYSGDGKDGVFKLDRIEYYVSGGNINGTSSTIAKFAETIDPQASSGAAGKVETECFSGSPNGKFNLSVTTPLEISRKDMKVLGITDAFTYQNKNVTAHTLKNEDTRDFYSYVSTANQVSLDEIEKEAFQPSDDELEIVFHDKDVLGLGEFFARAHYTYDPQAELRFSN